jgi:hypothetical protein
MSQNIYLHVSPDDFTEYHFHIVKQQTSRTIPAPSQFTPPPPVPPVFNNSNPQSLPSNGFTSVYTLRNNRTPTNGLTDVSPTTQIPTNSTLGGAGTGTIGISTTTIPLSSIAPGLFQGLTGNTTTASTESASPTPTQRFSTLSTNTVPSRNTPLNNLVDIAIQNMMNDLNTQNVEFTFNVEDEDPNHAANVQDINANSTLYVFSSENDDEEEEGGHECTICQSQLQENDIVRKLKCSHHFHVNCIDKWFETHSTCPTCRQQINEENSN